MNILLIGDIYGETGREMLKKHLNSIKEKYNIELTIVNGENVTHGKSILKHHYEQLKALGVDVITSGNHIFKRSDVLNYINKTPDLLKPLNMSHHTPGNGSIVVNRRNKKIRVTNIMGRTFMDIMVNNPYDAIDQLLKDDESDIHIVDMHAEATAEKIAFAWNYDGKLTCLVGTHTHVQTADNRILPKGTAFISDLGMTGPHYSIIGASAEEVIWKEKTGLLSKFTPAKGEGQLSGAVLKIDDKTNKAIELERILIYPKG